MSSAAETAAEIAMEMAISSSGGEASGRKGGGRGSGKAGGKGGLKGGGRGRSRASDLDADGGTSSQERASKRTRTNLHAGGGDPVGLAGEEVPDVAGVSQRTRHAGREEGDRSVHRLRDN